MPHGVGRERHDRRRGPRLQRDEPRPEGNDATVTQRQCGPIVRVCAALVASLARFAGRGQWQLVWQAWRRGSRAVRRASTALRYGGGISGRPGRRLRHRSRLMRPASLADPQLLRRHVAGRVREHLSIGRLHRHPARSPRNSRPQWSVDCPKWVGTVWRLASRAGGCPGRWPTPPGRCARAWR